jgi:hypothetical protein
MIKWNKYLILGAMAGVLLGTVVSAEKPKEMISSGYPGEKILIFPEPSIGPNGDIIKFVIFNAEEVPKVSLDIGSEVLKDVEVTKISFEQGIKFFGWFDVPQEELYTIWINDNPIVWEGIE